MSIIHKTTMNPGKLELLAPWLPTRPWFTTPIAEPVKAGGFRLDDPKGEVGIEFMVVTVGAAAYHVPLSYRSAPLEGAEDGLIGTSEHGVLGLRWIYDGTHDPVLRAALLGLLQAAAGPQMQSVSDTPDPSVTAHFSGSVRRAAAGPATVDHDPGGTTIELRTTADSGATAEPATEAATIHVRRLLQPGEDAVPRAEGTVVAGWRQPDGTEPRGLFAALTCP